MRHIYTIREINIIKANAGKMTQREMGKLLQLPLTSIKNACSRYGVKMLHGKGYFRKGMVPWNKGLVGFAAGNKTRFTKGHLPANTRSDGEIRIQYDKCGRDYKYIRVSVAKWMPYHRYIWMLSYGDPGKNIIRFKDGNTMNCCIENLTLVTRGENMVLNTLIRKPKKKEKLIAYLV